MVDLGGRGRLVSDAAASTMPRRRAIAVIDGEHYPPVVREALDELSARYEFVAAAFLGGTEKIADQPAEDIYGLPVVTAASGVDALVEALARFSAEVVVDLSDEPIVSSADRFRLATAALCDGVEYVGADFAFTPPVVRATTRTPALAIIGTGKRVGKTAISAAIARHLKRRGTNVVVVAMGRGGPPEPELIRGDEVALTTADLLALAQAGEACGERQLRGRGDEPRGHRGLPPVRGRDGGRDLREQRPARGPVGRLARHGPRDARRFRRSDTSRIRRRDGPGGRRIARPVGGCRLLRTVSTRPRGPRRDRVG